MKSSARFLVFDTETDPFQYRVKPEVFLAGLTDGISAIQWWGDGCITSMIEWLDTIPPCTIYAHNGGKFDFFYLPWPLEEPKIINARIVQARLGKHILRDSFAIMPFALSEYRKTEIDYTKFRRECREKHKAEIMAYHRDDLRDTFSLVRSFRARFGNRLTVASTAMRELQKLHPVERKGYSHDSKFRPYYFGGRVECFETGDLRGAFKAYDVNSMYPDVMKNALHPKGAIYDYCADLHTLLSSEAPGFVYLDCHSNGALPIVENGKLQFPHGSRAFRITTHELRAAHELGLLHDAQIREGYLCREYGSFGEFVDTWATEKKAAKIAKDRIGELFAKLMLNSAYGKFGANPENYFDWMFVKNDEGIPEGWDLHEDWGWMLVLRKPAPSREFSYFDVATAASITGAARAKLMRGLANSARPIYCDTDSIICETLSEDVNDTRLGAWKLEAEGNRAIIVGKKMYALLQNKTMIKSANKGVRMDKKDFLAVAKGKAYTYFRDAPTFKHDGSAVFIQRTIKPAA